MLTVLIPAKNEEGAITGTVHQVLKVLHDAGIDGAEVLVVNDGSSDRTAELAQAAGARVVSNPHNVGYGRSLKRGIREAKHDTICITDADLTYPAEAIPVLLKEFQRGNDLVVGQRTGEHYRESALKAPCGRSSRPWWSTPRDGRCRTRTAACGSSARGPSWTICRTSATPSASPRA